jgi:penicillin-binding protein 1A
MVLGGLKEGFTPLEMAHAYETLARDGKRISGSLAASPGGPVAVQEIRGPDGDLIEQGKNKIYSKQVIPKGTASTAVSILRTVVTSGTGKRAQVGEFAWGKTGTTENNGDAWFCGGTEEITACVWVGHADSNTPMETEFAGQPVDGGTFPALIWASIVSAYYSIIEGRSVESAPVAPVTSAPAAPAPEAAPAPAPATGGGGDTGGGGGGNGGPQAP